MGEDDRFEAALQPARADPDAGITRRVVLRDGSAIAIAVMLSGPASSLAEIAVPVKAGRPVFLSEAEIKALRGVVDRFIPGKPEDSDDGALAAGCAEAIDALLGAFRFRRPRIYAGAPFSDRAGSKVNHFKKFLRLDPYEERSWRLRIQGSRGRKRLEFNGPVKGWQQTYREGLAALDQAAGSQSFADLPGLGRDLILRSSDERIADLVDVAFPHTYQFMYGAPEYGGNRELIGWRYSNYDGDVQPRGWTREQIEQPGHGRRQGTRSLIPGSTSLAELAALAPLANPEAAHNLIARSGDSLSAMRSQIDAITEWAKGGGLRGS